MALLPVFPVRFAIVTLAIILLFLSFAALRLDSYLPLSSILTSSRPTRGPGFPKKIWQTGPPISRLDPKLAPVMATWRAFNPDHEYTFLDDDAALWYVSDRFGVSHPDLVVLYTNLNDVILRADLLRLLCMWADGGVYTDIDTECLAPVDRWVPAQYVEATTLVVGIVADIPDNPEENRRSEIVQWTFLAKPAAKYTVRLVETVVENLRTYAQSRNVSVGEIWKIMSVGDVMTTTGPVAVTWGLYEALRYHLRLPFEWYNVTGLKEPMLVDDVLFLPINAFGSNQPHSHSGDPAYGPIFLTHHFSGSWHEGKTE